MNNNLRPYALSIDWLQLHIHMPVGFDVENPQSVSFANVMNLNHTYKFKFVGHGSKTYKTILSVLEDGQPFAQLSLQPYNKAINELSANVKFENRVLYEPDLFGRIMDFLQTYGFKYMGVTRLDLAYDFNELYGGLLPQHFIRKIQQCSIIKRGSNDRLSHVHANFSLEENFATGMKSLVDDVQIPERHSAQGSPATPWELEVERQKIYSSPDCLIKLPEDRNLLRAPKPKKETDEPFTTSSITWGSRSCGHQLQIYNKTLEMQQVKYKHHIAQRWVNCGLDINRDVYRIEMRLTKGAKLLKNESNSTLHILDINDLILDDQIEQLWYDYTEKYFKWFILDKKDRRSSDGTLERSFAAIVRHTSRLQPYRIFCNCLRNAEGQPTELVEHVFVPRTSESKNDYSRSIKLAMNVIEGAIKKSADDNADYTRRNLEQSYNYLQGIFGLEKKVTLDNAQKLPPSEVTIDCLKDARLYYDTFWAGTNTKWFDRASGVHEACEWSKFIARQKQDFVDELAKHGFNVPISCADEAYEEFKLTGRVSPEYLIEENFIGKYENFRDWKQIKLQKIEKVLDIMADYGLTSNDIAYRTHAQFDDLPF